MSENEEKLLQAVTRPEPIGETRGLIEDWERAVRHIQSLSTQLEIAKKDQKRTEERLIENLTPKDRQYGETFNIWFADGLLQIGVGDGECTVRWRKRPTKLY